MKQENVELPVRQLIKFSNYSLCITLPKEYIDNLGWQQGDRIQFDLDPNNQKIVLNKPADKPKITEEVSLIQEPTTNKYELNLEGLEPIPQIN